MYIFAALMALLALSGIVSADNTAALSATATQAQEVYLAADAAIPATVPGTASSGTGSVGINSNVNWDLSVQGTDGGHLKHTTIATEIATNALLVSIGTTTDQDLTGSAVEILDNQAYGGSIVKSATYKQTFTYDDLAGAYGITVTWTIAPHA